MRPRSVAESLGKSRNFIESVYQNEGNLFDGLHSFDKFILLVFSSSSKKKSRKKG